MHHLRFAVRSLAKTPGFTLIALVTIALGIGVNTSMFSLLNSLLLHSPAYAEPERLVRVFRTFQTMQSGPHSAANFLDLRERTRSLSHLAAVSPGTANFAEPGLAAELLPTLRVSGDFFALLGVQPLLGRALTPDDDVFGREKVIVLTEATWRQRFGADPQVIGRHVRLDGEPVTVVGVMPAGVEDRLLWGNLSSWRPLAFDEDTRASRGGHWLSLVGRLKPDVTIDQAGIELAAQFSALAQAYPEDNANSSLRLAPFVSSMQDATERVLPLFAMGLAGCVLLIACVNLANLLFARNILRAREHAIRAALGASRFHLIRQSLLESLVLALAGGALGVLIAAWGNAAVGSQLLIGGQPFSPAFDWRVASFALAVAALSAVGFGLLPALLGSRTDVNEALKQGARGSTSATHHRVRHTLIVIEVALALVLLSGAVFFLRGLDRFFTRDLGWQPANLLTATVRLPVSNYRDDAALTAFYDRLHTQLAALPGVEQVSLSRTLPFYGFGWGQRYIVEGRAVPKPGTEPVRDVNLVSPTYFATLAIQLVEGRTFTATDVTGPMRIVIGETMARQLWPDESAIGKRIAHPLRPTEWQEVIGVVRDLKFASNLENPHQRVQTYRLLARETDNDIAVAIRSPLPPSELAESVRRAVAALDAEVPLSNLLPAREVVENNTANYTLIGWILGGFAALGVALAAIGVYGVISGFVAQRTTEIGIRMALGAEIRDVLHLVLGHGLRLAALGALIGLAGVWGTAVLLRAIIPVLPPAELWTALAVTAALLTVTALACWLPARRAARINPLAAIRTD
jgi:predicted permease